VGAKGKGGRQMGKTGDWSEAVTELKNAAKALSDAADLLTDFFSGNVENGESKPGEKPVTLEAVRAVLADKSRSGLTAQVRALIEKYGASKLSEVDPGNYKALMAAPRCWVMSSQAGEPAHALLSASSSHRWLSCPPSARLSQNYEDRESDYAAEGTAAHLLCEYKLKLHWGLEAKDPTPDLTYYDQEMEECADGYVAYILELIEKANETCADPIVLIEQRLDYSSMPKDGFGTGDCVIAGEGLLYIVDYKHGQGVLVEAERNPQMMLYGLGALEIFDCLFDIDTVSMTIYQPRRNNISTYTTAKEDLYRWVRKN
jgi:hypothetical protein